MSRPRRHGAFLPHIAARLHIAANIALSALLAAMLLKLSVQFDHVFTIPGLRQPLTARAVSALENIKGDIACTVVIPERDIIYTPLRDLLREMQAAATGAKIELSFIDPNYATAAAADAVRRFNATGWNVFFESEGRVVRVPYGDLVERVGEENAPASRRRGIRFRGEQVCVTALVRLSRARTPVVYALGGDGERDFESYDPLTGYSDFAREIRREGYELRPLALGGDPVPDDADLLIVAGPRHPPAPEAASAIDAYLRRGGGLLLLLDRPSALPSGWEPLLDLLGVSVPGFTVLTDTRLDGSRLLIDRFPNHPISRALKGNAVSLVRPQVLDPATNAPVALGAPRVEVILQAPYTAWGESAPDAPPCRYDPGIDRRRPLPLPVALAVETEVSADLGLKPMRAFVAGDSSFAANEFLAGGRTANRDLLLNAVNWLSGGSLAMESSFAAEGNALQLGLSRKRQLRFWGYGVVCWPLATLLLGAVMMRVRKILS